MAAYHLKLLDPGITYRRIFPGLVPPIEEREAARFNGYTWNDWQRLPRYDRVEGVAYFRARRLIEQHQSDAQELESERQRKMAEAKARRR